MPDIAALSLRARLAIAPRLFAGYCERRQVDHPAVAAYLGYQWWFVGMDGSADAFGEWSGSEPPLVYAGLGGEWPDGFADHLAARGVPESEFRSAVCTATEVLHGSLYGAADEPGSSASWVNWPRWFRRTAYRYPTWHRSLDHFG